MSYPCPFCSFSSESKEETEKHIRDDHYPDDSRVNWNTRIALIALIAMVMALVISFPGVAFAAPAEAVPSACWFYMSGNNVMLKVNWMPAQFLSIKHYGVGNQRVDHAGIYLAGQQMGREDVRHWAAKANGKDICGSN